MFGWLKSKATRSSSDLLRTAKVIVDSYDDYLVANPITVEIRDVAVLPYPKQAILNAVLLELAVEENAEVSKFLIQIGLKLALFREGIGPHELSPLPSSLKGVGREAMEMMDGNRLAEAMAKHSIDFETHKIVFERALQEQREIAARLDQAVQATVKPGARR